MLEGRRFAFYPAIRNIDHNEWTLEQETWAEILAKNVESGQEYWIPRNHLGEISTSDSPVLIVGLKRELALRAGAVAPYRHAVVEMPGKPLDGARRREEPEPPEPRRSPSSAEARTLSFMGRSVAVGLGLAILLFLLISRGAPDPIAALFRPDVSTADQRYLGLSAQDGYHDTVAKLGQPESDEWVTKDDADLQFRALRYASRAYIVVLMGGERGQERYIGTLHEPGRQVLDSAQLSGGRDASAMMKNLPEF